MTVINSRLTSARPLIGFVVGAALLAAAALAIASNSDQFSKALNAAAGASWWLVATALLLPVLNWLIMSLSFWILMRRHGHIALGEMMCLIGSAWLLNYLPLRPGLLGRVAYHKAVNKIPVSQSIGVTVTSIACAGIAIGILVGICLACIASTPAPATQFALFAAPAAIVMAAAAGCRQGRWWIPTTINLRYVDLLVWTARYLVVFQIIGHPISLPAAAALAAVGQIAMLIPLVGNGLGLREWAVGVTAGTLPPGVLSASGKLTTGVGLLADLVNRVVEVACAVPVGLLSAAALSKRKPPVT